MVRLDREDWLRAARLALLKGGVSAVRVEPLASALNVTKGSFYWHFADRPALLEALLREWEEEADLLVIANAQPRGAGLRRLIEDLTARVEASERGEVPSDAAIFGWAAVAPEIAERVALAERERVKLLSALIGDGDKAEIFYMGYLGFILRRRHAPEAERLFALLTRALFADERKASKEPTP